MILLAFMSGVFVAALASRIGPAPWFSIALFGLAVVCFSIGQFA